ncbi:membrane protein [Lactococcus plantarum]|uniref:Membrane protein n=1 Tax=Pseudolactococcus plantarum TaxID=1365 RepID=A0A2A5S0E6_9LACT|nr:membrane protein [Lactococcus plantarum]
MKIGENGLQQSLNKVIRFVGAQKWILIFIPVFFILLFLLTLPRMHKGTIKDDQFTYTGTLLKGVPEGSGTMVFQNGDTYTGNFKSGKFNDQGTFTSKKDKWTYKGSFKNGSPDGKGEMISSGKTQKISMKNGVIIK